jgi:hypothetical protein
MQALVGWDSAHHQYVEAPTLDATTACSWPQQPESQPESQSSRLDILSHTDQNNGVTELW